MKINNVLKSNYFRYPALVPASNFAPKDKPQSPENVRIVSNSYLEKTFLYWDKPSKNDAKYFVVYYFEKNAKTDLNNPKNILKTTRDNCLDITELAKDKKEYRFIVTTVNRYKIESEPSEAKIKN